MQNFEIKRVCVAAMLVVVSTLMPRSPLNAQAASPQHAGATPNISIVEVPPAGTGGSDRTAPISGVVKGSNFANYKVVVYAFAGDTWWVQPTVASPLTSIDPSGNWQTITHLGSTYAALLVKRSYAPPATKKEVPQAGGDVLAVKLAAGK
jgi:hypothetical protein